VILVGFEKKKTEDRRTDRQQSEEGGGAMDEWYGRGPSIFVVIDGVRRAEVYFMMTLID